MHHVLMGEVRVGEHDLIDLFTAYELGQKVFGHDGDAGGIARPRERRRVGAVVDRGDLRRGERDDEVLGIVAEHDVEVVEVAALPRP